MEKETVDSMTRLWGDQLDSFMSLDMSDQHEHDVGMMELRIVKKPDECLSETAAEPEIELTPDKFMPLECPLLSEDLNEPGGEPSPEGLKLPWVQEDNDADSLEERCLTAIEDLQDQVHKSRLSRTNSQRRASSTGSTGSSCKYHSSISPYHRILRTDERLLSIQISAEKRRGSSASLASRSTAASSCGAPLHFNISEGSENDFLISAMPFTPELYDIGTPKRGATIQGEPETEPQQLPQFTLQGSPMSAGAGETGVKEWAKEMMTAWVAGKDTMGSSIRTARKVRSTVGRSATRWPKNVRRKGGNLWPPTEFTMQKQWYNSLSPLKRQAMIKKWCGFLFL